MNWLLDTNVVSEWVKPAPSEKVVGWLADADEDRLFLSVATLAELRLGVEALAESRRRQRLAAWLEDELPTRFEGRILGVDAAVAHRWGVVVARSRAAGVTLGTMDGFFAATAAAHGLTLVTRNTKDFAQSGIALFNPWEDEQERGMGLPSRRDRKPVQRTLLPEIDPCADNPGVITDAEPRGKNKS